MIPKSVVLNGCKKTVCETIGYKGFILEMRLRPLTVTVIIYLLTRPNF